jgi:hypothetical protein
MCVNGMYWTVSILRLLVASLTAGQTRVFVCLFVCSFVCSSNVLFEEDDDLPRAFPIDSVLRLAAAKPPKSIGRSREDTAMDGRPFLLHHRSSFGSVRRSEVHARDYNAQGWAAEAALRRSTPNAGTDRRLGAGHRPAGRGGCPGAGGRRQRRGHGGQVHVRTNSVAVSNPVACLDPIGGCWCATGAMQSFCAFV